MQKSSNIPSADPFLAFGQEYSLLPVVVRYAWLLMFVAGMFLHPAPAFAAQTNAAAAAPVWLAQPMSLADAISMALLQNASIRKGQSDLEVSQGVVVQTRAIALPKVRGTSGYTHDEAVEKFPFPVKDLARVNPPKEQWNGELRIIQTIYEGGRIRSAWQIARLTRQQALYQYNAVVADALLQVRTAYFNVVQAEQHIVVQEASVALLTRSLKNSNDRFEAGTVPRFDVLRSEVELASARPRLIRAKNQYLIAKNNLATLLGYNIPANIWEDIPITLTGKLESPPYQIELPAAIAEALERRPELGVFRKTEGLRKEQIVVAKAGYKPRIGLFAGYGAHNSRYFDEILRDVSGGIAGVEFNWDIFDGNLTKGKVMEAKAYYEKAVIESDEATRRVELEVRTAYSTFMEAREVLESQKRVQERAEEALRLAESRYDAGSSTQLDVLSAQTSLTEARTTQINALRDYSVARAQLGRSLGEDVPREAPPGKGK